MDDDLVCGTGTLGDGMKPVVLKLSGEAFAGHEPLNGAFFEAVAEQIRHLVQDGYPLGVVVGGGNIHRGNRPWGTKGLPEEHLHEIGIDSTVLNARTLTYQLQTFGVAAELVARPNLQVRAARDWTSPMEPPLAGQVYVVGGGTGRGGVSTDVAAIELARDLGSQLVVMSKYGVNAIFDGDPRNRPLSSPAPSRIDRISTLAVLELGLAFMDREAVEMSAKYGVHVRVIGASDPRDIYRLIGQDRNIGSLMYPAAQRFEQVGA